MKRWTTLLIGLTLLLAAAAACRGEPATDRTPTPTATGTPTAEPTEEAQDVTFSELFSDPDQYKSGDIRLEGFYFDGFETTVLSERLEYTGQAEGHLWPRGQMVWIEGNLIPGEIYGQLYEQRVIGPTERYGKLRIKGRFDYGARYGHVGGFAAQIVPSDVELLPWSPPPAPTPPPTLAPTPTPTAGDSPIAFVMEDNYALRQRIEIKIRNNGPKSHAYSVYYPACYNLKFYDESVQARQLKSFSGIVELPPGLFIVPEGTHCDLVANREINPGEEVVLLTWSQRECVEDNWGCTESVPVKPGTYTIVGEFPGSMFSSVSVAAEWSFAIIP